MINLTDAPKSIQLAVDLIYLLETHQVDPKTVLEALEIVKNDYEKKISQTSHQSTTQLPNQTANK